MPGRTIVVVGGALSGPTAAARARETDETARIVLVERARDVSYAAGGLAYHLSGEVPLLDALNRERAEFFRDVYRIEVRTGATVTKIEPRRRRVIVDGEPLGYTALVHALGAGSPLPDIAGLDDAANVFFFRTLRDLEGLTAWLESTAGVKKKAEVVVLGGGFFGVEAADGLARRGCAVTLLEWGPRLLPRFSATVAEMAREALARAGVSVLVNARVAEAERDGAGAVVRRVRLEDGRTVAADAVIVAAGLRPRSDLLRAAGARLRPDGTVVVDDRCATSLPRVFACGVCVALPHAVTGKPVWFAQAAQADKTAQVAGTNAAGGRARMRPVVGTALVRAGALTLGRTGLSAEEAARFAGRNHATAVCHAPARDVFFPGAEPVTVELHYDRKTGRLLGADLAGRDGVDKRLDVLATALRGKLVVEALADLDLGYAPPFAAARDPVNVAGAVAAAARAGLTTAWTPDAVGRARGKVVLVDVRGERARSAATIAGAVALPLEKLRDAIGSLPRGKLVFFCDQGRRSYLAARIARQRGRRDAGYLSGGLTSWRAAGGALVAGAEEPAS
jgi:NADPH-dependent 2,4-dienoyl-CoA reductase/sulfur reductase-like enzyme/rhodanese-related sulfurtransferase